MKHPRILLPLLLSTCVFIACDAPPDESDTELRFGNIGEPETIAAFNPQFGETPESVAIDFDGNFYISMALTGEVRRITPEGDQSTHAVIPLGQCAPNPFPAIMGAIAIDVFQNLYVGAATCDPANRGVWRIEPDGDTTLVASLPPTALPNGIAVRAGRAYVADSASTIVWRAETYGDGSPAEVWTDEPLLADPDPFDLAPGANGLQFFAGSIYVANAGAGTIVEIPFSPGGLLGGDLQPEEGHVKWGPAHTNPEIETGPDFPGCDDFAFDWLGRLYCTTDPFQSVLRLNYDGSVTPLLLPEDGIDGPTAATFGRHGDKKTLYVTNAAFPFFPSTGNGPSLMSLDVGVAGYPFR